MKGFHCNVAYFHVCRKMVRMLSGLLQALDSITMHAVRILENVLAKW